MSMMDWIDERTGIRKVWKDHLSEYYAPKNFNFWYFFGSLALLVLVIQIMTGIWLAMFYKPSSAEAFASIEYIMRDVEWGWLIRYMHSTGATAFFIVIYLHMFRGIIYGSFKTPRELVWLVGVLIYIVMMATAFMGYLLPWGQMSFWGAQVIVNLFAAIPVVGEDLAVWIRGDYVISDATLNRFFALHFLLPFILVALVFLHIMVLHKVGSNNPDGIEIKKDKDERGIPKDGIPFHPYYTVKDILGVVVFLMFFAGVIFFWPEGGGYFLEKPNFEPSDPLKTPDHIAPVWYFTPYYAILRAVPSFLGTQVWGVIAMGLALVVFFILPWLDSGRVKSIRYRSLLFKLAIAIFVVTFLILGYLGVIPSTADSTLLAQLLTLIYFGFFFLMPVYAAEDRSRPYTKLRFIAIMALATGATLYYWWGFNAGAPGSEFMKSFVSISAVGYFVLFAIKPFLYPGQVKKVPQRIK